METVHHGIVPNASPKYNGQDPIYPEPRYMDIVTFECNPGYEQVGGVDKALRRVCNKTGQWVLDPDYQDTFSCQRVSCGSVPTVTLATPSRSSGVYEDVVTYTCNTGYYNTGTATPEWGFAAKQLSKPPPNASSGVYPEDVSYVCNTGYDNSGGGAGLKTCNVNGQWEVLNGNPDPVCTFSNADPSRPTGTYGDKVTYTCATGYSQTGGGLGRRTCTASGNWA
nr:hypothetical protein BaRGS_019570 [Batillaria attramentaria]